MEARDPEPLADEVSHGEPDDGDDISSGDTETDGSESESANAGSGEDVPVDPHGGIDPNDPATWPDNQLGAPAWMLPTVPPSPDLEPPHESPSPQTHEEKMKKYWDRFVVPWPPRNQPEEEPMESDGSGSGSDSDSGLVPPSSGHLGGPGENPQESMVESQSDHVDSETLNLSDFGEVESSLGSPPFAPESDEDSDAVSESKFAEVFGILFIKGNPRNAQVRSTFLLWIP